jgi:hypothetical protein
MINEVNEQKPDVKRGTKRLLAAVLSVSMILSLAACTPEAPPEPQPEPDTTPPVIECIKNLETDQGVAPSYREGVSATDETDGAVPFTVDTSAVDLETPGFYEVVYEAEDSAGNHARVSVRLAVNALQTVPVDQEPEEDIEEPIPDDLTEETVYELADKVLARITNDEMDLSTKAWAIYNWTYHNIRYVGTSDKSSWIVGAYVGFVRSKGDCFNYYAVAKALLHQVGIETVDLTRVPSRTRHYWLLANIGTGWYHFDACPHPNGYPFQSFFVTEEEVREYTALLSEAGVRENYFTYDYSTCMVPVVGTPEGAETEYGWYLLETGQIPDPNGDPDDPNGETNTEDPNGEQNTEDPNGEQNAEDPNGEQTAEDPNGEQNAEDPNGETNTEDPNGEQNTEDPNGETNPEDPNGEQNTEDPNGETAGPDEGGPAADQPGEGA